MSINPVSYNDAIGILKVLLDRAKLNVPKLLEVLEKTHAIIYGQLPWYATYEYLNAVPKYEQKYDFVSRFEFLVVDQPNLFYDHIALLYPVFYTAGYQLMDQLVTNTILHLNAPPVYNWTKRVDIFYHQEDIDQIQLAQGDWDWTDLNSYGRKYPVIVVYVAYSPRTALPIHSRQFSLQLYTDQQLLYDIRTGPVGYDLRVATTQCPFNKIEYDRVSESYLSYHPTLLLSMIDYDTQLVIFNGSELYSLGTFTKTASIVGFATMYVFIEPLFAWRQILNGAGFGYGNALHQTQDVENIITRLLDSLERFYTKCVSHVRTSSALTRYGLHSYSKSCMQFLRKHLTQTVFILSRLRARQKFRLELLAEDTDGSPMTVEENEALPNLVENVNVPIGVAAVRDLPNDEQEFYIRWLPLASPEEKEEVSEEQNPEFEPFSEEAPRITYITGEELEQLAQGNSYLAWNQFHYPADWQFAPLTAESVSEQNYNQLLQTGECIDFIELGEVPVAIRSYIEQDSKNNIVILPAHSSGSTSPFGANAVCYTRAVLESALHDPTAINLPCVGDNHNFPADGAARFVRVSIPNNVYVPEAEVQAIADRSNPASIYQAEPSELFLQTTSSVDSIVNNRFTSGDHCQAGSGEQIYHLRPVIAARTAAPAVETVGSQAELMQDSLICNAQPTAQWLRNAQGRLIHCRDIQSAVRYKSNCPASILLDSRQ